MLFSKRYYFEEILKVVLHILRFINCVIFHFVRRFLNVIGTHCISTDVKLCFFFLFFSFNVTFFLSLYNSNKISDSKNIFHFSFFLKTLKTIFFFECKDLGRKIYRCFLNSFSRKWFFFMRKFIFFLFRMLGVDMLYRVKFDFNLRDGLFRCGKVGRNRKNK